MFWKAKNTKTRGDYINGESADTVAGDARYVNLAGDTMTGDLVIGGVTYKVSAISFPSGTFIIQKGNTDIAEFHANYTKFYNEVESPNQNQYALKVAAALVPISGGAQLSTITVGSYNLIDSLDFDQTTEESATWSVICPSDGASYGLKIRGRSASTGDVVMDLEGIEVATGEDVSAATPTASGNQTISVASADVYYESTLTISNAVTKGDLLNLALVRKAADGLDTLADDFQIHDIQLIIA